MRKKVPLKSLLPLVPVFKKPGQRLAVELRNRICPVCHRNDLEAANRRGELVLFRALPTHLACAIERDSADRAEPLSQTKPVFRALRFKVNSRVSQWEIEEIQNSFVLPQEIWEPAEPAKTRRLEAGLFLANLAVPKPGAEMVMEVLAQ